MKASKAANWRILSCYLSKLACYSSTAGFIQSLPAYFKLPDCTVKSKIINRLQPLMLCSLLMLAIVPHALATETLSTQPLVMGIHPYKSASSLLVMYKPLAAYLSRKTGRPVNVAIAKDYATHIRLIGEDKVDIAYMGPASYIELVSRYGKKPLLARQEIHGRPTFQGKIIVRQDSPLQTLANLVGTRFAFGDPASTMSHLVPRYMLLEAGVTVDRLAKYAFLRSHDNVALAVLAGDYDAGAVKEGVYNKYQPRGLKILATTPALSEHLFVSSKLIDDDVRQNISEALLRLKNDPQGTDIMYTLKPGMTAWVEVSDTDYDNLRMVIEMLAEEGIHP